MVLEIEVAELEEDDEAKDKDEEKATFIKI